MITAVGMVTPVGHTATQSCASINAGLSRIAESFEFRVPDEKGHQVTVNCASVIGVTDGHRRFLRHYRMAVRAFVGKSPERLASRRPQLKHHEKLRTGHHQ